MYTCALIVKIMISISGPLNNMQLYDIINDLGYLLVFFKQSSLYFI